MYEQIKKKKFQISSTLTTVLKDANLNTQKIIDTLINTLEKTNCIPIDIDEFTNCISSNKDSEFKNFNEAIYSITVILKILSFYLTQSEFDEVLNSFNKNSKVFWLNSLRNFRFR